MYEIVHLILLRQYFKAQIFFNMTQLLLKTYIKVQEKLYSTALLLEFVYGLLFCPCIASAAVYPIQDPFFMFSLYTQLATERKTKLMTFCSNTLKRQKGALQKKIKNANAFERKVMKKFCARFYMPPAQRNNIEVDICQTEVLISLPP